MTNFEYASQFFRACEAAKGWEGCKQYAAAGATFTAQCEPLTEIDSVEAYCDWMAAFGNTTAPGATYDLLASSYDESTKTALFFGTYHAKHTGDGGPVPPTGNEMHTHYVYALTMNGEGKIVAMTKIWNAPWAMKELGWA